MRARKREVFARLVRELRALDERFGTESSLAAALDGKPNNARLASLATYYECVPGFERLLAESSTRPAALLRGGPRARQTTARRTARAPLPSGGRIQALIPPYVTSNNWRAGAFRARS